MPNNLGKDARIDGIEEDNDGTLQVHLSAAGQAALVHELHTITVWLDELAKGRPYRLIGRVPERLKTVLSGDRWPWIAHLQLEPGRAQIIGQLQPSLYWFQGHFPGEPILPGVVQLNWAIELGRIVLEVPGTFTRVEALKFQHVLQPGRCFALAMDHDPDKQRLAFAYTHGEARFSQGRVLFDLDGSLAR